MTDTPPSRRRFLACLLYESLVVFAILLIGFLLPQVVLSGFHMEAGGRLLWMHVVALLGAYFVWCWLNGGQTLPMKTWCIRVVDRSGKPLRPLQAIVRYGAAWLSTILLGAGFAWALLDPQRRTQHDLLAGSMLQQTPETKN